MLWTTCREEKLQSKRAKLLSVLYMFAGMDLSSTVPTFVQLGQESLRRNENDTIHVCDLFHYL